MPRPARFLTSLLFHASVTCARGARLFECLAAGTLTRADLRDGIARTWGSYNTVPEEVFSGLGPWEQVAYAKALRPGGRVLVVGSGTGRELLALAAAGYEVVGVEPSPPARAAAAAFLAQRGVNATIVPGFFEDVAVPGLFDAIIFSFYSYSYIPGSAVRVDALRKAAAALRRGGVLVVSYIRGASRSRIAHRLSRCVGRMTGSPLPFEPGDEYYRIAETPPYFAFKHAFVNREFEEEVRAAGLKITDHDDRGCPVAIMSPADGSE